MNPRSIILTVSLLLTLSTSISAAPGDLDPTFGNGGKVILQSAGFFDVAIQPDGKIVAVGGAEGGSEGTQIVVARYNINGSPDTTFGVAGSVFIDRFRYAIDVAIQPDGKIVVATRHPYEDDYAGEIIRLNSDGSLDASFGTNGTVADLILPSVAATLPDGKLLINILFYLYRFNANGSFDSTFGPCKIPNSVLYVGVRMESVIQPDGRIVTPYIHDGGSDSFAVSRCNADGTLDTGFGSGGAVLTPVAGGDALSVALQTDGKIVVAGYSKSPSSSEWRLTVIRYHPNGSLDTGFGTGGIVTTPKGSTYFAERGPDVAIQTDGKIVAVTTIENHLALVRYNPNGSPDTTLNGTGIVITPITNVNDYAQSVAIQADGKIVVAGAGAGDHGSPFFGFLVRYQGDAPSSACSSPNPIDCPDFFVRQHYRDFLSREPDASGLAFWTNEITFCVSDAQCAEVKRINVSAAFFLSIEFQQSGYLVYRFYKSAFGNLPGVPVPVRLSDFLPDAQAIGQGVIVNQGNWQQQLETNKQNYANAFVQRLAFTSFYPTSMTPGTFVDTLFANAGVIPSSSERAAAVAEFSSAANTADTAARARALRLIAENSTLQQQEFNRAFVLMQYFGYLRRNPNDAPDVNFNGYNFWLNKLNQFNGNFQDAAMVKAFLVSTEYRQRFGQ